MINQLYQRDWDPTDPTLAKPFQELKDLFCKEGDPCWAFPMPLGGLGAGHLTLTIIFSKEAMSGVLQQMQFRVGG